MGVDLTVVNSPHIMMIMNDAYAMRLRLRLICVAEKVARRPFGPMREGVLSIYLSISPLAFCDNQGQKHYHMGWVES